MRSARLLVVFARVALAGCALSCPCAAAESSAGTADALFREGRAAMKAGDVALACEKFSESLRLDPARGTLLNLALCEEQSGRLEAARAHLSQLLSLGGLDAERRAIAADHAARIAERLELTRGPPPPAEVPVAQAGAGEATRASSGDGRAPSYLLGALGLASLATGAFAGVMVLDRKETVEAHCQNKVCDEAGLAAGRSGRTFSAISTVAVGAGVLLTGVSAYLLLRPSDGAGGARVDVVAGRDGAAVSLAGAF